MYQQWLAQTRHNWLPACPIYDLSSQASNSILGSSVDTLSASLPIDSAPNINPDLADSQQTVTISSQNLQSPNIDPSSCMDLSNTLIINERVGGYRRDRDHDSDDSTSADSTQRPSRRSLLSTDSHSRTASDTQYSRAL